MTDRIRTCVLPAPDVRRAQLEAALRRIVSQQPELPEPPVSGTVIR